MTWLSSVCWVIKLNTPKWDILAKDVAVYCNNKLQTYQSISQAKGRETAKARNKGQVKEQPCS